MSRFNKQLLICHLLARQQPAQLPLGLQQKHIQPILASQPPTPQLSFLSSDNHSTIVLDPHILSYLPTKCVSPVLCARIALGAG
jgi:hypothetical protein